jgi:glycine dehydrogenase
MLMPSPRPLGDLEHKHEFHERHIGPSADEQVHMLKALGYASRTELRKAVVPASIARKKPFELPPVCTEAEALQELKAVAAKNKVMRNFIGQGYYNAFTPGVILRNVLENPAWYTAYTPYQPEISQGRLEALINFQTMVTDLTGMAMSNASMLDEATAAAEAMSLALRMSKTKSHSFFVADDVLPQTLEVIQTRAQPIDVQVVVGPAADASKAEHFAVLLQYPGVRGDVRDYKALTASLHSKGCAVIVAADLLALALLSPPGEWGADICVGNTQRFGLPLGFGGPHAAFMAVKDEFKRSLPGRLAGVSIDSHGNAAYRLTLQTREQHIRREKATSNICTAQVLPAVIASMFAVYHGPHGIRRIAERVATFTAILAAALKNLGYSIANDSAFDTLTVVTGDKTQSIHARARAAGINLREVSATEAGISLDETVTRDDIAALIKIFDTHGTNMSFPQSNNAVTTPYPAELRRTSDYLTHPVFNSHHSETEMLRYLRMLADKDIALDRAMIPLGSCTMKLNATSEMIPVTWPEFGAMHPLQPLDQVQGYLELDKTLSTWMCQATGYDDISLQPNAGSQGEYAGLLVIEAYHRSRGEAHRNVCLIPASAHGTNPASAQMVGMKVVVVKCDDLGNVDLADLRVQADAHKHDLAACMITYPSTHGVFEEHVREICDIVHAAGGQVYVDGANMNALVGVACPPEFGADVSHLNLHKTFCIPHGGGGPGVGPVAVRAHLAPFLPVHRSSGFERKHAVGAVSAARLGNAAVLPISWMYCRMMGADGLTAATEVAILSANYIAKRLEQHYPVLYTGQNGRVAHECILDLRPLKDACGISNEDVAKRLIDYGFHAPTMSFPVPGTLMVEPTESESLHELDRFCDAMIAIRAEIAKVEKGEWPAEDNPLKHAPFTAEALLKQDWNHVYTREQAAYPVASLRKQKYWVPVGRVDNVYGDRNLQCSCIPISEYA